MAIQTNSVNVRINRQTHVQLVALAKKNDMPMQYVIDKVVEAYWRQSFLKGLNEDFAALQGHAVDLQEEIAERAMWEMAESDILDHVQIDPPEGGMSVTSFIKCEEIRSVSKERLIRRTGRISYSTLVDVEDRVRILLGM